MITCWRYAIFNAIYPKICYLLCHLPQAMLSFMPHTLQQCYFFLNLILQYLTLTPSYANSSYAMFSGQSQGRILGYCCTKDNFCFLDQYFRDKLSLFLTEVILTNQKEASSPIFKIVNFSKFFGNFMTLCTGMEILAWFLVEAKYYSHTWFLYTTGLLRYQGPPEKWKKAKKFSKSTDKATATLIEIL